MCFQIFTQPLFGMVDRWFAQKFPNSGFINNEYIFKPPLLPAFRVNLYRLCSRTSYVGTTTGIAMIFPYFNQVLGLIGALNFWPLALYFPVNMYFVQRKIGAWTRPWLLLQVFSFVCLVITIFAFIGSVKGIIIAKQS